MFTDIPKCIIMPSFMYQLLNAWYGKCIFYYTFYANVRACVCV
jgi:hypothetical protein